MNEALRKELERYYCSCDYGFLPDGQDVEEARGKYNEMLDDLRERKDPIWGKLEYAIAGTELAHERQGFLRGYEYCLTMLGLNNEKAPSQQGA